MHMQMRMHMHMLVHMHNTCRYLLEEPVLVAIQGLLDLEQELVRLISLAPPGLLGGCLKRWEAAMRLGPAGRRPEALHRRRAHRLGRWPALPLAPPVVHLHRARRHRPLATRGHAHRRRRGHVRAATEDGAALAAELHALDDVDHDARVEPLPLPVLAPSHRIQAGRGALRLAPAVERSGLGDPRQASERRGGPLSSFRAQGGSPVLERRVAAWAAANRAFKPSCCTAQRS